MNHTPDMPSNVPVADAAVAVARQAEDYVVGDEIVRHRASTRAVHWAVAITFTACVFTGMPIWTPLFGWMAYLFGGLHVCRWLHPFLGLAFVASMALLFAQWFREMLLEPNERGWFGRKMIAYMRVREVDPDTGKYNGGQKLLFWASTLAAVALVGSGVVMWFPEWFGRVFREAMILLHDATFVLFLAAIFGHVYLGTAAEPGTFRSMTRGTVTKAWARFHHPRWYREVLRGVREPR